MLAALTREFILPRRVLTGVLALVALWAAVDAYHILSFHARYGQYTKIADVYWSLVGAFAPKYLMGFAACVILGRARVSLLSGGPLLLALVGLSAMLLDVLGWPIFRTSGASMVGGLITMAASPRGGDLMPFLLLTGIAPMLIVAAIMATAIVVTTRVLATESLLSRATLVLWATYVLMTLIAFAAVFGAFLVLRSQYGVSTGYARGVSGFVPLAAALVAFLAIGAVHRALYRRAASPTDEERDTRVRAWLCTAIVVGFAVWAPYLMLGLWGARAQQTVVRPALRAVGILPTPKLAIESVRVDLPYVETGVGLGHAQLFINASAHQYRSRAHPDEPIDIVIHSRKKFVVDRYTTDIESELKKALQEGGAEAAGSGLTGT